MLASLVVLLTCSALYLKICFYDATFRVWCTVLFRQSFCLCKMILNTDALKSVSYFVSWTKLKAATVVVAPGGALPTLTPVIRVKHVPQEPKPCDIRTTVVSTQGTLFLSKLSCVSFKDMFKKTLSHYHCHKLSTSLSTHLIMGVSQHRRKTRKTWQICIHVMSGDQIICKAINWMSFHIWSLCCPITPTRWGS